MKTRHYISIAVVTLGLGLIATSCNAPVPEEGKLFLSDAEAQQIVADNGGTLMHLNDFVSTYMTKCGTFFPVRERSYTYSGGYQMDTTDYTKNNLGWFSVDTIPVGGPQIYIRGRIVTDDQGGNFYKTIVIQEIVNDKQQALRLSVDASSAGGAYLLGQEIMIHVNGLGIGKYANEPQLCVPSYNDNIYAQHSGQKVGWAPGRIPAARFAAAVTRIGRPDVSKIQCDTINISEFINVKGDDSIRNVFYHENDARLVCFKNVFFTGEFDSFGTPTPCDTSDPNEYKSNNNANTFAPSTAGVGFPQGRIISDGTNKTIVSTSEYAKFACYYLPGADENGVAGCEDYKGTITGILGHYTDNGRNPSDEWDWSVTLRDFTTPSHKALVEDIVFVDETGEPWIPEEYSSNK